MSTNPRELDRRTGTSYGGTRTTTTRRPSTARTTTPQSDINQWSTDAIVAAAGKANNPVSLGGWVSDNLYYGNQPTPPAAPPGGGGGGRGGGMAADPMVTNFGGYAAAVQRALAGMGQRQTTPFSMAAPTDKLTPMVNQAVDADLEFARQTMGGIDQRTSDPYAGLEFFAQQFDPGVSGVLGAQGAAPGVATAQQMAGQSDQDYMAQLFNNLARTQSANQQASNQAWNADVQRDSAAVQNDIGGQRTGLLAAAGIRQEDAQRQYELTKMQWEAEQEAKLREEEWMRQQAILELLSSGWQAGADVSGVQF